MPNPSYFQTAPLSHENVQPKELLFHLYMYQHTEEAPGCNQRVALSPEFPNEFGRIAALDWVIRDGLGPEANIVARAQGFEVGANMSTTDWFICQNILFTDDRFKGSTLKMLGNYVDRREGEWAIIGGTGEFAYAQGVVTFKVLQHSATEGIIRELRIRAMCLTFQKPSPPAPAPTLGPTKIGPWGGHGGSARDIIGKPRHLESVKIYSGWTIDSIAFTYIDQSGQRHTEGPWGGSGGNIQTIQLHPSEFLKEVSGTVDMFEGHTVITSLRLVTNIRTYGPFGRVRGTPFSATMPGNSSIVSFFGRSGAYLDSIGVYAV